MKKRRPFTPAFQAQTVLRVLTGAQAQAEACRKHGVSPTLLATGKAASLERAHTRFDTDAGRTEEQAPSAEREQVLGRRTLEHEIRKRASSRPASFSSSNER
jgi:transposase-like protein